MAGDIEAMAPKAIAAAAVPKMNILSRPEKSDANEAAGSEDVVM